MSNHTVASLHQAGHGRHNRGPASFGFVLAFTAVATVAVFLRLYVRLWIVKAPGWDDAAIILSLILAIVSATCYGVAFSHGYGQQIQFIPPSNLIVLIKWNVIGIATFYLGLLFSKMSVSLLLLRIIGRAGNKYTSGFLYSMMALATIITVIATGTMLGQYGPIWRDWDNQAEIERYGGLSVKIGIAQGVISALIDFALASFPLTILAHPSQSSMPRRRKLTIAGLMSCGMLAGVSAIARVIISTRSFDFRDYTYDCVVATCLAVVEEVTCIVLACVPCLTPLIRVVQRKPGYMREGMGREMVT